MLKLVNIKGTSINLRYQINISLLNFWPQTAKSLHWLYYCTLHFKAAIHFWDNVWSFLIGSKSLQDFNCLVISVLVLEKGWDHISRFNPITFLCMFQARNWISNAIWKYVMVFFVFNDLRWGAVNCFIDIGATVDHHCLNYIFIKLVRKDTNIYILPLLFIYNTQVFFWFNMGTRSPFQLVSTKEW